MTAPREHAADPDRVPAPGRPVQEQESHGPSDMPDAQRPEEGRHPEPGPEDTADEQIADETRRDSATTHGPAHEERPVRERPSS